MTPAALCALAFLRDNPGGHDLRTVAQAAGTSQVDAERALWDLVGAGLAVEMRGEWILWPRMWRAA